VKDLKQFPTVHSHPASLDSASTPLAFARREVELGSPALTVTDHGTIQAGYQIYDLAKAKKWPDGKPKPQLTPIIGLEAYFRDDNCPILTRLGIPKTDTVPRGSNKEEWAARYPDGTFIDYNKYFHITLHAQDHNAYLELVRLLSKADFRAEQHGSERKPLFDWSDLESLAGKNVTATSGCLIGMVQRHLLTQQNPAGAKAYFERLKFLFGDRFYTEVFPHRCTHNYVKAVFVDVGTAEKKETLRFHFGKKLMTNAGEMDAEQLATLFHPDGKHQTLVAVRHYRSWKEYEAPMPILAVRKEEGFLKNECQPWCPDGDVQLGCNKYVLNLAKKHNVPVVIGDDSHFATADEKIVQDIRLSQGGGAWKMHSSYHRQSSQEAFSHFEATMGISEAVFEGWVDNALAWVEGFKGFKFETTPSLPTGFYPEDTFAHTKAIIKAQGRYRGTKDEAQRLKAELDLLGRNDTINLLPYFFVDEEVCGFFESKGLLTGPGRGSAAGLLLAYLEGITHVDPLKYGLSMDRFMTPDRIKSGKLPDIDQDLPKKHRDLLLDPVNGWLFKRFGANVAQISVDTTLKLKNAVKDVARAKYGFVPNDVENWTKRFEMPPQGVDDFKFVMGYEDDDEIWHKGSIESDQNLQAYINAYPDDWEAAKKCLGLTRQKGRHACAHVIANKPIDSFIPLTTVSGIRVTSFTAGPVEAVGGIKMDFLGIGSLDDIGDAIQLIQERHVTARSLDRHEIIEHEEDLVGWGGPRMTDKRFSIMLNGRRVPSQRLVPLGDEFVDICDLPEDQAVFKDVAEGRTETVFQFNTPSAVQWLSHFNYNRPDGTKAINSVETMAAFTALDRPGPLDIEVMNPDWQGDDEAPDARHNMLVEFARRARGATPSPEVLPVLDQLVPETLGIMTYQEQLQYVYQKMTGCTGAEAEEFRTNVAKKRKDKVDAAKPFWMEHAGAKIGHEDAEKLWEFLVTWAKYGFNKSHAVCYAVIAYACAYLKHHYPLEWWCAVLKNASKEEINKKFWPHCGKMVLLPDIQYSKDHWVIEGDHLRAPLNLIHGIGDSAHEQLMAYAPYTSIDDFAEKIKAFREKGRTMARRKKKAKKGVVLTEENAYEMVSVLGRSNIHRGIVHTLVVSGSMGSLFPPGATVDDCMAAYDSAMVKVFGRAYSKAKKKDYPRLDPIGRYQMRKSVIPAYGEDLRPLLKYAGNLPASIVLRNDGKSMRYVHKEYNRYQQRVIEREDPVIGSERFTALMNTPEVPDGGWYCAVLAYLEEKRPFSYAGGSKQACELLLDVGGAKNKLVYWPDEDGRLPPEVLKVEVGSIVLVLAVKFKPGKPFSARQLECVRPPQSVSTTNEEEENDTNEESAA
jgi:DNA polymerase III alpha subunit